MDNSITTTNVTNLPTRLLAPQPPDRLNALLLSGDNPVVGPNTATALRGWIGQAEAYEASLERPTRDRIETMVGRLSIATIKRNMADAEAHEAHDLYHRVLRDLPVIDLAAAFDELLRTAKFMPKPAEIHAAAAIHTKRRAYRISRARHLVWKHETEWKPPFTPADATEVAGLIAQASADLRERCSSEHWAREAGR